MSIRLDDVDYFLAVAKHGKVRRAAEALGVSQPAITQALHRLESEWGFPLFFRSSTGMQLTPAAQPFYERICKLRSGLDDAVKEASDLHLGERGLLRVGVSTLYIQRVFVPAALELQRQRPAARLRLMFNLNDRLQEALHAGDIDLCISALPRVVHEDLTPVSLLDDPIVLVVNNRHPLLKIAELRLEDLSDESWLLPASTVNIRREIEGRFAEAGLPPPRVVVEFNNGTSGQLNPLIENTNLIGLMSESTLNSTAGAGLKALPLEQGRFIRKVGILYRNTAILSPLAQRFIDLVHGQHS
ncbi:LysR family transcriptional regulator [Advenella kashmirensis W13003]|uniref:LysR family transcriptional regulator n=1 Tax=Advenella kashmirensis W13003 TaxID=1424334 RepID=V8QUF6_9BURK|nr:LysR family transcriptional regulator [Advenella kashmirensis]ETF02988.1 LysR family transcriptional regulator [Advenella kashmirensis W13003]